MRKLDLKMLTSNSSGQVIPLPDSPLPKEWYPIWLPVSIQPPMEVQPFKVLSHQNQNCLHLIQSQILTNSNFQKLFIGAFITYNPQQKDFQCNLYTIQSQTNDVWNNWKQQILNHIQQPNDNINGIFYVYRPWLLGCTNKPLSVDKQSLVWMMPKDQMSRHPNSTIQWKCPPQNHKFCSYTSKQSKIPSSMSYPNSTITPNLKWNDYQISNTTNAPCFMKKEGCQGELNIINRCATAQNQFKPNSQLPLQLKPNSIQKTNNQSQPFSFQYNYSSIHTSN